MPAPGLGYAGKPTDLSQLSGSTNAVDALSVLQNTATKKLKERQEQDSGLSKSRCTPENAVVRKDWYADMQQP